MGFGGSTSGALRQLAVVLALAAGIAPALAERSTPISRLSDQISAAAAAGRNEEGLAAAIKLEPLVRRQQGTQGIGYAGVLHNQGMFLHNLGRYREAADKLDASLAIKLREGNVDSALGTSAILTGSLTMLGRQTDAMDVAKRALAIGTQAFGPDDPRLARPLSSLGGLAREQENFREAEGYFARVLALRQAAARPDPHALADALDDLGDLYGLQGRFDDGERLLKQSLRVLEQGYGAQVKDAPNYAKVFNDLGNLYRDAGRFVEAESAYGNALALARARLGDAHPNVAANLGNLASVMNQTARYVESEGFNMRALLIYEKVFGQNSSITAIALNNLANNYLDQGRPVEAMGLLQRVLAIREKSSGPDAPDSARAMNNLANAYESLGQIDEADALFRRSLRILSQRFGDDSPQTAIALASVARLAQKQDRLDEAADKLARVLKIDETAFGPNHPTLVNDLRSLAFLDLKRDQPQPALPRLQRALAIAEAKLGPLHRRTLATMINLAEAQGRMQQWPDALALLRRASVQFVGRLSANGNRLTDPGPAERFTDLDTALLEALWHVGAGQPDATLTEEAFAAAQRACETRAGAALAQMAARFGAGSDAIAALVRRQQDLKTRLDALETAVTTELGAVDSKRNDGRITGLRAEAAEAKLQLAAVSERIAREFPGYGELASPAPLPLAQAAALLKPDEGLLSYLVLEKQSFVFAVTREARLWRQIPLGAAAISERVAKLRAGLFNPDPNASAAPFDLAASHELYTMLFAPVDGVIAGKSKLLVVPSGALTSLPFQVLVTRRPDPAMKPDERLRGAAWLLNDRAITVLPSVSSLRALRSVARASRATKPFIGFGDPVFRGSGTDKPAPRSLQPYQDYYKGSLVDLDALRRGLAALPETADELRAVARALGAAESEVRLGRAVTVTSVQAAALEQYRVVDFATHGLVAGEVGGLSEPALVLTLPDNPTADDDGLLTASRVAKLNLDADWAVLSACNTAAGDRPGAEGLSGLARAFFYAGARALLVSHWPVESDAAVKLVTGAFTALAKDPAIGRAEALRRSTRALIADRSLSRNAEPSVWAPFVLVGEGN